MIIEMNKVLLGHRPGAGTLRLHKTPLGGMGMHAEARFRRSEALPSARLFARRDRGDLCDRSCSAQFWGIGACLSYWFRRGSTCLVCRPRGARGRQLLQIILCRRECNRAAGLTNARRRVLALVISSAGVGARIVRRVRKRVCAASSCVFFIALMVHERSENVAVDMTSCVRMIDSIASEKG